MDVVNTFNFDVVYDHADAVREAFRVLGTRIHTAHLKDVRPMASYFPNIEECYVGEGIMDFRTYLGCLDRMPRGFPAVLEHMSAMDDIGRSYRRMCEIADTLGVAIWDEDEAG